MTVEELAARGLRVKPLEWERLGVEVWALDCPATGGWFASSEAQRDSFEAQRSARIAAQIEASE